MLNALAASDDANAFECDPATDTTTAGWRALTLLDAERAVSLFSTSPARDRSAALGGAVTLLELSPTSPERVAKAERALLKLAADATNDDPGRQALWLLARIALHHQQPRDAAKARRHLEALAATDPDGPFGQRAVARLILLDLQEANGSASLAERLRAAEEVALALTVPAARRDSFLILARFALERAGDVRAARRHYREAWEAGVSSPAGRSLVLIALGELARREGDLAAARDAWTNFVREFPRDSRVPALNAWLEDRTWPRLP